MNQIMETFYYFRTCNIPCCINAISNIPWYPCALMRLLGSILSTNSPPLSLLVDDEFLMAQTLHPYHS